MSRSLRSTAAAVTLLLAAACGSTAPVAGDRPAQVCAAADGGPPDAGPALDASASADAGPEAAPDDAFVAAPEASPEAGLDAPGEAPTEGAAPDGPPICDDNVKDGDETDIDCGGTHCQPCSLGQTCLVNADCGSWPGCDTAKGGCACDGTTGTCVTDHCSDHKIDAGESDVDCGGGECGGCAVGQKCVLGSDCESNGCDLPTKTCAASTCSDHVQDANETAVDCGGGECPGCAVGEACGADWDCADQACDAFALVCDPDPCFDHHQDGTETDIDCGGATCAARCALGSKCITTSDCAAGHTCPAGNPHVCY